MTTRPVSLPVSLDRSLLAELAGPVRRVRLRQRLQALAWITGSFCFLSGVYLLIVAAGAPQSVVLAIRPLLVIAAIAVLWWLAWKNTRVVELPAVASELDARVGLKDEVKSACWFASRSATTEWEALHVARATARLRDVDVTAALPVRLSRRSALAASLGVFVMLLGVFSVHNDGTGLGDDDRAATDAAVARITIGAPTRSDHTLAEDHARTLDVAAGADPRADARPTGRRAATAEGGTLATKGNASSPVTDSVLTPGDTTQGRDAPDSSGRAVGASGGSADRAPDLSLDVAKGVIARLQEALGWGAPQSERAEPGEALTAPLAGGQADTTARQDAAKEHTALDALTDALRGLSKTPDGDRPMLDAGTPGGSPSGGGRTSITGGASGMRVNLSDAGDGGTDTPPDAPLSEPQSVKGKPTERLGMQLNRHSTGPAGGQSAGEREGFFAASQAQAARVAFTPIVGAVRGSKESAMSGEQVPLAYREVVKRYVLQEHGRQP